MYTTLAYTTAMTCITSKTINMQQANTYSNT